MVSEDCADSLDGSVVLFSQADTNLIGANGTLCIKLSGLVDDFGSLVGGESLESGGVEEFLSVSVGESLEGAGEKG